MRGRWFLRHGGPLGPGPKVQHLRQQLRGAGLRLSPKGGRREAEFFFGGGALKMGPVSLETHPKIPLKPGNDDDDFLLADVLYIPKGGGSSF